MVAKLGEPANQAGRVFQSTVEWIIYVHYKNNWVSKYPSCGALLAQCNIFIMSNQLKNSSCKAVLKCPFGETAGTSTVTKLLAKYTPKMNFTIRFRKSYIFTPSKSYIIYYLDLFQGLIWLQIPNSGASANAISRLSWLSQNKAVWSWVWGPRCVRTAAVLWPREDGANVTFLKCFDVNLRDRKVPPCRSEGIGFDNCPLKYRLLWTGREHFQFALKRLMYFSCSTPIKVRPFILVLE